EYLCYPRGAHSIAFIKAVFIYHRLWVIDMHIIEGLFKGPMTTVRGEAGRREERFDAVLPSETALVALRDGARYPELEAVRQALLGWRLYHDFRTDPASPIRQPCQAIVTPTLAADGSDLAAVLATLALIRQDTVEIDEAIADAFPGAAIHAFDAGGSCRFEMKFPDMPRAFAAHELSDGTVKYLCLLGALLSYRMPSMVALNEPEASLHPSLLPPLARLIGKAVEQSRLWVVTHSDTLAEAIERETLAAPRRVEKIDGATRIAGLSSTGEWREERDDES
ncbi:MAG: AAA family ATPase, partial [Pseudomonadota bacterium]